LFRRVEGETWVRNVEDYLIGLGLSASVARSLAPRVMYTHQAAKSGQSLEAWLRTLAGIAFLESAAAQGKLNNQPPRQGQQTPKPPSETNPPRIVPGKPPKPRFTNAEVDRIMRDMRGDGFKNNPLRISYERAIANLANVKKYFEQQGMPLEKLARKLHQMRRDLGVIYKNATPQPLRDFIFELNRARYGDPLGGSFEFFMRKYNNDLESVIRGSWRPNSNIDGLLRDFEQWLRSQ